jgi:hypothetical protein
MAMIKTTVLAASLVSTSKICSRFVGTKLFVVGLLNCVIIGHKISFRVACYGIGQTCMMVLLIFCNHLIILVHKSSLW